MDAKSGWTARAIALLNEGGPWGGNNGGRGGNGGGSGGGNGNGSGGGNGPRNPWSQPPGGGRPRGPNNRSSAMDEFTKRLKGLTGNGAPPPQAPSLAVIRLVAIGVFALWIVFTSFHQIGPQQAGVITRFGRYVGKLNPGIGFTFPSPIDSVQKVDVQKINTVEISGAGAENLVLTSDQNIVDLAYSIRWDVREPELYLFQLAQPDETIREVGESAMREVLSQFTLNDAIGAGRTQIEQQVALRMQALLDQYRAGVRVQGIAIKKADPPDAVNEAFKKVSAAQQAAQTSVNQANAYAQQITAKAEGEASQFDKVYEQYKLAPIVTRRRMYYETMEDVLGRVDKTIVETPGATPYLALPELKRRAAPPANETTVEAQR